MVMFYILNGSSICILTVHSTSGRPNHVRNTSLNETIKEFGNPKIGHHVESYELIEE